MVARDERRLRRRQDRGLVVEDVDAAGPRNGDRAAVHADDGDDEGLGRLGEAVVEDLEGDRRAVLARGEVDAARKNPEILTGGGRFGRHVDGDGHRPAQVAAAQQSDADPAVALPEADLGRALVHQTTHGKPL